MSSGTGIRLGRLTGGRGQHHHLQRPGFFSFVRSEEETFRTSPDVAPQTESSDTSRFAPGSKTRTNFWRPPRPGSWGLESKFSATAVPHPQSSKFYGTFFAAAWREGICNFFFWSPTLVDGGTQKRTVLRWRETQCLHPIKCCKMWHSLTPGGCSRDTWDVFFFLVGSRSRVGGRTFYAKQICRSFWDAYVTLTRIKSWVLLYSILSNNLDIVWLSSPQWEKAMKSLKKRT